MRPYGLYGLLCISVASALTPFDQTLSSSSQTATLGPAQIVAWRDSGNELSVDFPVEWLRLRDPIGTVCITGDDRIGKSTLLTIWGRNLSASPDFQFSAGHTMESHTKGLWSAVMPSLWKEGQGRDYHVNLCDSQGLKRVSEAAQWNLFATNVLTPSVLVYMLYNVIQNDQLRDLARMAHQFQKLSVSDPGGGNGNRFARTLSPHLVVVVRDENSLGGENNDLSEHLEDALKGSVYAEDKALIKRIFPSREAWSLSALPLEVRKALKNPQHNVFNDEQLASQWRGSADHILGQVLREFDKREKEFPRGGPELAEWYNSVVETVNSNDMSSIDRLVGYAERLEVSRRQQAFLQKGVVPIFVFLSIITLLMAFGGCLDRWLNRAALIAWTMLWICYLGSSHLLRTPLNGIMQKYCDEWAPGVHQSFVRGICLEASSQSAAVLIGLCLGAATYPLLIAQFKWLIARLPLPDAMRRSGAAVFLVLGVVAGIALQEIVLDYVFSSDGSVWTIWGRLVLGLVIVNSARQSVQVLYYNRRSMANSQEGRDIHRITLRFPEVAKLEQTPEWKRHYRAHHQCDAIWRFRTRPFGHLVFKLCQAVAFLLWGWLIHPSSDIVFLIGVGGNTLYLVTSVLHFVILLCKKARRADSVDSWIQSLEDSQDGTEEDNELRAHGANGAGRTQECPTIEETREERAYRLEFVENMREIQEYGTRGRRKRSSSVGR